jgi:hypothetical protein
MKANKFNNRSERKKRGPMAKYAGFKRRPNLDVREYFSLRCRVKNIKQLRVGRTFSKEDIGSNRLKVGG